MVLPFNVDGGRMLMKLLKKLPLPRPHLAAMLLAAAMVAACSTAPVTGRQQVIAISESQATELGAQAYQQILAETPVVTGTAESRMVKRVGRDIAAVVDEEGSYDWEFNLLRDDTANAFALPGGKVGVNTGLFKVVENEDQLAAVMAHEIGHVTARHSSERMTQQLAVQAGLAGIGVATGPGSGGLVELAAQAATLGITLPFSRTQEAEADEIGLIYMARAGYDPRAAIEVWQNFQSIESGGQPEFLSTHPAPASRIEQLRAKMPEALEIYRQSQRS